MEKVLSNNTPYRIRLSKKAVRARIVANHTGLEVVIPERTPLKYAEKFAEQKADWMLKMHHEIEASKMLFTPEKDLPQTKADFLEIKRQLKKEIKEIILNHHELLGQPKQIRLKNQKTRWGSCSNKEIININWKLAFAPKEVRDYVIIHEICHLTHMNHSRDFWSLVEKADPFYKRSERWLKKYSQSLMAQIPDYTDKSFIS